MGIGYWNSLATLQAAGPTLTASTTATSLLNAQAKITLPAGFFAYAGQRLKVVAQGQIGNVVTTPGTLTLTFNLGSAGATIVWNSGAIALSTTVHTTLPFWLEIDMTVRTLGSGSAATLMPQGRMSSLVIQGVQQADAATILTHNTLMLPTTVPATTTFDSTIANVTDLVGTWSINNADAITVQQYELISTNWGG